MLDDSARCFCGVFPALHAHQRAFDHHNGVIDQHAQGDDQRTQRNTLHVETIKVHPKERARYGHKQNATHQDARAQPHKNQQRANHDGQCKCDIDHEIIYGRFDRSALIRDWQDLDANRAFIKQLGNPVFDRVAHVHDIAAACVGNAQTDGRFTIAKQQRTCRLFQPTRHRRNVPDTKRCASLSVGDQKVLDCLN